MADNLVKGFQTDTGTAYYDYSALANVPSVIKSENNLNNFIEEKIANLGGGGGNNSGSSVIIDATLSQKGQAADAQAVGQALENKIGSSELQTAVNEALEQAKEKGDFKGDPGDDYVLTNTDKEEIDPENNISCPLAELNLISVAHKKNGITTYKKTSSSSLSFNKWIILAIICDNAKGKLEISIDDLLNAQCNIGKCFNLDSILLLDILQNIEKSGELKIIRTAGLDVIQLTKLFSFEDCVQNFYKELNK